MHSQKLPPLRFAASAQRGAAAPPLPTCSTTADYTYTPPLKAYTAIDKHSLPAPTLTNSFAQDSAATQENGQPHTASASHALDSIPSAAADTSTPHHTAAVFQAKLQRALWLDQRTSCLHEESSARAGLRCGEAEARDALWWPFQRERAALAIQEEYARRCSALFSDQISEQQHLQRAQVADVAERDEPDARRALEQAEATSFQLLCGEESTDVLRLSTRLLTKERERADVLARTAQRVRGAELNLARRSYRDVPAFDPFVGDLSPIAEGLTVWPTHRETPLEEWRRKHPRPAHAFSAPLNSKAPLDQATVKVMELYARRSLRYDEEKERLLLDWWKEAGVICLTQEAEARRLLWRLHAVVTSPAKMRAVVALQRWWRILCVGTWSRYRQQLLHVSLTTMPHWHSAERYKRRLRALDRSEAERAVAAATVAERLESLVTAATHPRRYALQLSLFNYSSRTKVRAFAAGVEGVSWLTTAAIADTEQEAELDRDAELATFLDKGRQTRWRSPSTALLEAERPSRGSVTSSEAVSHGSHKLSIDGCAVTVANKEPYMTQETLAAEAARTRLRIERQEAHERQVWMLATPQRTLALVGRAGREGEGEGFPCLREVSTSGREQQRLAAQQQQQQPVGTDDGAVPSVCAAAEDDENLARARRCVQQACETFSALQTASSSSSATAATADFSSRVNPTMATLQAGDAFQQYGDAFDRAAASVYAEQYTTVHKRFTAVNANLLKATQDITEAVLNDKATLVAEESVARVGLVFGHSSGRAIAQLQITTTEAQQRVWIMAAEARAAQVVAEYSEDSRRLLHLALP